MRCISEQPDVSKFMYFLELVEPGKKFEGTKFHEARKVNNKKHVFKTLIVSSVVQNQNLTLRWIIYDPSLV